MREDELDANYIRRKLQKKKKCSTFVQSTPHFAQFVLCLCIWEHAKEIQIKCRSIISWNISGIYLNGCVKCLHLKVNRVFEQPAKDTWAFTILQQQISMKPMLIVWSSNLISYVNCSVITVTAIVSNSLCTIHKHTMYIGTLLPRSRLRFHCMSAHCSRLVCICVNALRVSIRSSFHQIHLHTAFGCSWLHGRYGRVSELCVRQCECVR